MCGLIYAESFTGQPVNGFILDQYEAQMHRGKEGFGLFNGQHLVHAAKEDRIVNWLCKPRNQSELLLFHHRNPTSTINVRQAAHPFTTKDFFGDTEYVLIHNGYIENAYELSEEHEKRLIDYQSVLPDLTFNDSEALLWDFALFMEGEQPELKARGAIATIAMKLVKGKVTHLYFGRNNNPLYMLRNKDGLTLSSEGDGESIERNTLYTYNYARKRLTKRQVTFPERVVVPAPYSHTYTGEHAKQYDWEYREETNETIPSTTLNGNWLPDNLTKYKGLSKKQRRAQRRAAKEFLREHRPLLLPGDFESDGKFYHTEEQDVAEKCMMYLAGSGGNFNTAYWRMEADYKILESQAETTENLKQKNILKAAIWRLDDDPEYVDSGSISSVWRVACQTA